MSGSGVGGNCVHQENLSGGTHFPRKFCPTGQDILSTLGQIVRVWFLTNSIIKGTDDGLYSFIVQILAIVTSITEQQRYPQFLSHDE